MFRNMGTALTLLRELRGKSQARVSREACIGKSQLSKYENGKELPKLDSLEKVLKALQIGYFELFYTVHMLDQRVASLGGLPNDLDSAAVAVWAMGALSQMSPATEEAFQRVFMDLLTLYRQVFDKVVFGALPAASLEVKPESPSEGEVDLVSFS
ncbi:MAG TPA: helix-turn-helix transcriptional regulator [Thermoanaerobaculia bacterium]|nr:helix-turn-helix transcriptional regulator [Thermoanaerobaculia bacterium]